MKKGLQYILLAALLAAIAYYGFSVGRKAKAKKQKTQEPISITEKPALTPTTEPVVLKDGRWVHQQDSLAILEIKGDSVVMQYTSNNLNFRRAYTHEISKNLPGHEELQSKGGQLLVLSQPGERLIYEVISYTDSLMQLTYIANGQLHEYRPQ